MSGGLAQSVLQHAVDLGVCDFCVCTGSRNSDLIHGLLQNFEAVNVHPFFEERSAAFFALGRHMTSDHPVAVVTTSGTAVAELLPAAIEAHYQRRPLIFITADRPASYRGSGSPQAIEQAGIFGHYAQDAGDITASTNLTQCTAAWPADRPLHLNILLEEPREIPSITLTKPPTKASDPRVSTNTTDLASFLKLQVPLLVMAGCWQPDASWVRLLEQLQAPILADLTSGLHGIPSLQQLILAGGDQTAAQLSYERVLRLGGVPSFRAWRDLEAQPSKAVLSISQRPFPGLARRSRLVDITGPLPELEIGLQEKPGRWRAIAKRHAQCLNELLEQYPDCEVACLRRLFSRVPDDAIAFLGNSLPIREGVLATNGITPQQFHANRGANGIDGSLSTFLGSAQASECEHWGFFGDLTTLYDLSAPSILAQMAETRIRIVVINNGGGKIFRLLPNWQGLDADGERVVENTHGFDFAAWAQAWGLGYSRIGDRLPTFDNWQTHQVLEIKPDQQHSDAFWKAWRAV
jgi:2-succinyl-5-enolpyruvyl-6-hydroxy-3-cyclohexene-1-carboxylate synthase